MGAYTFRRARERMTAKLKESDTYTYEQLDAMKVPEIKALLDSKEIEYKSNNTKKELIAYIVEVPEESTQDSQQPDGDANVDSN